MKKTLILLSTFALFTTLALARPPSSPPVMRAMEGLVDRMRRALGDAALLKLDQPTIDRFLTPQERQIFAEEYWAIRVNVPVRVSVMRHREQAVIPFWLSDRGFRLTTLRVRNAAYEYEVWQKDFSAGRVGLGINGFDKHRVHYFVSVQSVRKGDRLRVQPVIPAGQQLGVMERGASIYHDWPSLVLTDVPVELEGGVLLPTIRGRAREAHLIGGFRITPFPSGDEPDQVMLTFPADPKTAVAVQWRTSSRVTRGLLQWRQVGTTEWRTVPARSTLLRDTRILNDPVIRRHEVVLRGLRSGTTYEYTVSGASGTRTSPVRFRTAPANSGPFTFVWLSDTHNRPDTRDLLKSAVSTYPGAAFCAITGDLVGTGQYRDDWDQFFAYVADFARERPLVPTLGNHDTIDGLGADLYLSLFALPRNGARALQPERSYHFTYGDALFIVLDCTDDIAAQRPWLEQVLRQNRTRWKFALFHFPPYALSRDYPEIERHWCPLFDRYHVDFVLSGHVHHLQRSHPIRGGNVVSSPAEGTIYAITVAVGQRRTFEEAPAYAAIALEPGPPLFHAFQVDHNRVTMRCHDASGKVWDELVVEK